MSKVSRLVSLSSAGFLTVALHLFIASAALADHYPYPCVLEDGSSIAIPGCNAQGAYHLYFGATIGQNWSAMPDRQHVNWKTDGPYKCALDISGDVYITEVASRKLWRLM